jgi:hypothetical protein
MVGRCSPRVEQSVAVVPVPPDRANSPRAAGVSVRLSTSSSRRPLIDGRWVEVVGETDVRTDEGAVFHGATP